ncbi:MAG TPA: hypothetical protein VD968_16610, partial [Pyrinomonadaceae bacterium]|nr:hypothetical protein [Pyrinomonadaceae bacterium]
MSRQPLQRQSRRSFLRRTFAGLTAFSAYHLLGCSARGGGPVAQLQHSGSAAEPEKLSYSAVLTQEGEPGEPLVVSGRIFAPDGKTPVEGVTLYVYHTDARGLYSEDDGNGG